MNKKVLAIILVVIMIAGIGGTVAYQSAGTSTGKSAPTPTPPSSEPLQTPTVSPSPITNPSSTPLSTSETSLVGLSVGNTFTYNMTGISIIENGSNAVTPAYLSEYNNTEYYQVTITGINASVVTFNTLWQFTNGTAIPKTEWVNLANGNDSGDFWGIYAANLNLNNLLRPNGYDNLIVNSTDTQTFTSGVRDRNYWSSDTVFTNVNDPTGSTQQYNYIGVFFDKQTGMLTGLTNVQEYNNPVYSIIITWKLTGTNVWFV